MNRIRKEMLFFIIGALGYGIIEILWRGYTHWSMLIAGGICFTIFSYIEEKFRKHSLPFKAFLCSLTVTGVEIVFGFIFNIILNQHVWDYSNQPLNLYGQVCLLYSILWGVLGFVFIPLAGALNKKLAGKQ